MGQTVLIAESRDILRAGLQSTFASNPLVSCVYQAATSEEMEKHLRTYTPDLTVVHQSLITNIILLPQHHFVVVATEPDKDMLFTAFAYGARGYLLENASSDLFHLVLRLASDAFLLDPKITSWLFKHISGDILPAVSSELLTTREREIFELLLNGGLTNRAIGEKLCISEATVKTHLAHIFRKLNIKRRPMKIVPLPGNDYNESEQRTS